MAETSDVDWGVWYCAREYPITVIGDEREGRASADDPKLSWDQSFLLWYEAPVN